MMGLSTSKATEIIDEIATDIERLSADVKIWETEAETYLDKWQKLIENYKAQ